MLCDSLALTIKLSKVKRVRELPASIVKYAYRNGAVRLAQTKVKTGCNANMTMQVRKNEGLAGI